MRISALSSDVCSSDLTKRQIVVGMHAALGFRLEHAVVGPQPLAHTIHVQRAAAVGHINAVRAVAFHQQGLLRSEEHTSELQSLMRISYAVFCLKNNTIDTYTNHQHSTKTSHIIT